MFEKKYLKKEFESTEKLSKRIFNKLKCGKQENEEDANINPRSCKRSETLFKSLLFWLAGEVSWLAVEVLSPY